LFLICTLDLFAVGFASSAHARVDTKDTGQYVEFVQDIYEDTGGGDVYASHGTHSFSINSGNPLFTLTSKTSVPVFFFCPHIIITVMAPTISFNLRIAAYL